MCLTSKHSAPCLQLAVDKSTHTSFMLFYLVLAGSCGGPPSVLPLSVLIGIGLVLAYDVRTSVPLVGGMVV